MGFERSFPPQNMCQLVPTRPDCYTHTPTGEEPVKDAFSFKDPVMKILMIQAHFEILTSFVAVGKQSPSYAVCDNNDTDTWNSCANMRTISGL